MTFISFAAAQSAANDLSRRRGMEAASRLFQGMLGSVGQRPKGLLLLLLWCGTCLPGTFGVAKFSAAATAEPLGS